MSATSGAKYTAACVQITSAREFDPNIKAAGDLVRRARDAGADLIMTPEITGMFEPKRELHLAKATDEAANPALAAFRNLARETGAWILVGSLAIKDRSRGTAMGYARDDRVLRLALPASLPGAGTGRR